MTLYNASARAIKSVDPQLKVGGPATAQLLDVNQFHDLVRQHLSLRFHPPPSLVVQLVRQHLSTAFSCGSAALTATVAFRPPRWPHPSTLSRRICIRPTHSSATAHTGIRTVISPEPEVNTPACVLCMSGHAEFESRVVQGCRTMSRLRVPRSLTNRSF